MSLAGGPDTGLKDFGRDVSASVAFGEAIVGSRMGELNSVLDASLCRSSVLSRPGDDKDDCLSVKLR